MPNANRRLLSTIMSVTPIRDAMNRKITSALQPSVLEINNESHKHAHHAPMIGNTNPETHFQIEVVSTAFEGKNLPARHRIIYKLLKEEMEPGKIHALQMKLRTEEEYAKRQQHECSNHQSQGETQKEGFLH